jgi:hypothetical protein
MTAHDARGTVVAMRSSLPAGFLVALAAAGGLAACGSDPPAEVVVTVTATPSAAATAAGTPSPTRSPRASAAPRATTKPPASDVEGRRFDFGLVTAARRAGKVDVLVLDRWTDPRVDDDALARRGLPVRPWRLGSNRYRNVNATKTFDIPVRDGAAFRLHHCLAAGDPLQTRSVGAAELAKAPAADRLLLVRLDGKGWATGGETLAGC